MALLGGWERGGDFRDQVLLAVIVLLASGVVYLSLMRCQGVAYREALLNWPMAAVAGVAPLLLQFRRKSILRAA